MQYMFDHESATERERLAAREAVLDSGTIRHLETFAIGDGWRCLEIRTGGGTIAKLLYQKVGRQCPVVATDLQTKFLHVIEGPIFKVRSHNTVTDKLEEGAFALFTFARYCNTSPAMCVQQPSNGWPLPSGPAAGC